MKKLLILLAAFSLSATVFAQLEEKIDPVDVRVGTYVSYEREETFFLFTFTGTEVKTDEPSISVVGPAGWNGGNVFESTLPDTALADDWYRLYASDGVPVVGTYKITVTLGDGKKHTFERKITEVENLLNTKLTLIRKSEKNVRFSWKAIPGALAYIVRLEDDDATIKSANTTGNSLTFTDLSLEKGKKYWISVEAVNYPSVGYAKYLDLPKMVQSSYSYLSFTLE